MLIFVLIKNDNRNEYFVLKKEKRVKLQSQEQHYTRRNNIISRNLQDQTPKGQVCHFTSTKSLCVFFLPNIRMEYEVNT